MENIMPDIMVMICKKRGVELGEEFKLSESTKVWPGHYRIEEKGLEIYTRVGWHAVDGIEKIITGEVQIVKLPFVPHLGDEYYSVNTVNTVNKFVWRDYASDYQNYAFGNCFRTAEEAKAKSEELYSKLERIYIDPTICEKFRNVLS